MKQIEKSVASWIHRNARAVELAVWCFHFESGDPKKVLDELLYFQNEDGGFGHGLEADSMNPLSAPSQMYQAIHILDDIQWKDASHPLIMNMLRYLDSGADMENDVWISKLPSNNEYPHAPWWTYYKDDNSIDPFMPSCELCSFILKFAEKDSGLYQRASSLSEKMIAMFMEMEDVEVHSLGSMMFLLRYLEELKLTKNIPINAAKKHGYQIMRKTIETDPNKWNGYCVSPSFFIMRKHHPLYEEFKESLHLELQKLLKERDPNGVWEISWIWGMYEKEYWISANWWKSTVATQRMRMLKDFDLI